MILVGSQGPDLLELWDMTLMPGERYEAKPHPSGTLELIHKAEGSRARAPFPNAHLTLRRLRAVFGGMAASAI
jgi:hypothetical protein